MQRIDQFGAFNASVELSGDSTEFGLAVSDWVSTMVLDFYSGGALVTSFTTSSYSNIGVENHKYFQMTGGTFDRVDVRASATVGNWCIPAMSIESSGPTLSLTCGGGSATASVSNATPNSAVAFVYGPAGVFVNPGATCNGLVLDLIPASAPLILGSDAAGAASVTRNVGAAACGSGILVQAADVATCVATNSEAL